MAKKIKHLHLAQILVEIVQEDSNISKCLSFFREVRNLQGTSIHLYRADLFDSMLDTINFFESGSCETMEQAAIQARQRQKHIGRKEYHRIVANTLLVKGLEFQHAIVLLDADNFDAKNLYVALTRGSISLTIISNETRLTHK